MSAANPAERKTPAIELAFFMFGVPGGIRTPDPLFRRQVL